MSVPSLHFYGFQELEAQLSHGGVGKWKASQEGGLESSKYFPCGSLQLPKIGLPHRDFPELMGTPAFPPSLSLVVPIVLGSGSSG
jgi:hypothetical protein